MSNDENGKDYENFVESVYKAILCAKQLSAILGPEKLERRKKILSKSGTSAEIDIYWEFAIAGIKHCVAIECKNYNRNVSVQPVREFARKISDISGLKGLMVTKKGFSADAVKEAKADNIDLLIIRPPADEDFAGHITKISVDINIIRLPKIISLNIFSKKDGNEAGGEGHFRANEDKIILEDIGNCFKYSIRELREKNIF